MHKKSYEQLVKIAPLLAEENGIKKGQFVCPFNNYTLIKDMKSNCKEHIYKVNQNG